MVEQVLKVHKVTLVLKELKVPLVHKEPKVLKVLMLVLQHSIVQ